LQVPLAKPVGWYHIFHRDDLKRIAPLWLEFCGKVRTQPEKYWSINGSIPENIPTGDAVSTATVPPARRRPPPRTPAARTHARVSRAA
jgi:hypothetical protein